METTKQKTRSPLCTKCGGKRATVAITRGGNIFYLHAACVPESRPIAVKAAAQERLPGL